MNQQEHTQEAKELLKRADEESNNGGNERIAAEFLWGALAHCLIAAAQKREPPHDSHGAFKAIARRMDTEQNNNRWSTRFGTAEKFHSHFYHGNLPSRELPNYRSDTREAALELLKTL